LWGRVRFYTPPPFSLSQTHGAAHGGACFPQQRSWLGLGLFFSSFNVLPWLCCGPVVRLSFSHVMLSGLNTV